MQKCNLCNTFYSGERCPCSSKESGLKCYGCGGEYKGTNCHCRKGVDIDEHRKTMNYWQNWQPPYDLYGVARGLIVLNFSAFQNKDDKLLTTSWKKTSDKEKAEARQLWRDGWRPHLTFFRPQQEQSVLWSLSDAVKIINDDPTMVRINKRTKYIVDMSLDNQ
jgi:hypothetical protein